MDLSFPVITGTHLKIQSCWSVQATWFSFSHHETVAGTLSPSAGARREGLRAAVRAGAAGSRAGVRGASRQLPGMKDTFSGSVMTPLSYGATRLHVSLPLLFQKNKVKIITSIFVVLINLCVLQYSSQVATLLAR